jgi:hypothetical protein
MTRKSIFMDYTKEEVKQRFEAALRGSRIAGHKTMKDIPKRNGESRAIHARPKPTDQKRKRPK